MIKPAGKTLAAPCILLALLAAAPFMRAEDPPLDVALKSPPNVWWTGTGTGGYLDPDNWRWMGTPGDFPYGSDKWVGLGTGIANKTIDFVAAPVGDTEIVISHMHFFESGYVLNIKSEGTGRMVLNFDGFGFVRDNSDTAATPAYQNVDDIIVHVGENGTLKYSGAGQASNGNWSNRKSRLYLDSPSSMLDLSSAQGSYAFGQIQAVEGSVIKMPNGSYEISIGDSRLPNFINGTVIAASGSNAVFRKSGDANLYFNGTFLDNGYGRFQSDGGGLFVNGVIESFVRVGSGYIAGSGTVLGRVELQNTGNAMITAGSDVNEVGTLTITGNLTMNQFTTLYVKLAGSGTNARADKIIVGGTTIWNNAYLKVQPLDDFELIESRFVVLESGTLSPNELYQWDGKNLLESVTMTAEAWQDGRNIMVSLKQQRFSDETVLPGLSENQKAIAAHVDQIIDSRPEGANKLLNSLNRMKSANQMRYAFSQLAPMGLRTWYPSLALLSADICDNLSARRRSPVDDGNGKWEMFAAGSYLNMGFEQARDYDIAKASAWRFMGGASYRHSRQLAGGFYYSKDKIDANSDGFGGTTKIDGDTFGVFGEYSIRRLRASVTLFYSADNYTSRRSLSYAGGGFSEGKTSGSRLGGCADVVWDLDFKGWKAAPFAGLQFMSWSVDGFTESTSTMPVAVSSQEATSLLGKIGIGLATEAKLFNRPMRPFANLGFKRELADTGHTIRVAQGGSEYDLKFESANGGFFLRGGIDLEVSRRLVLQLSTGYDNKIHASDNYGFHAAVGFRF